MATVNIYVPDSLKTSMDECEESKPNWSAVCQTAIKNEITRIKAARGEVSAIVARVRSAGSKQFAAGHEAGKAFALEEAGIDDFEAFESYNDLRFEQRFDKPTDLLDELAGQIGADDASYFIGDHNPNWRWLDGFAKAMQDTFATIKPDLLDL